MDGERISTREWVDKAFPLVFYRCGGRPVGSSYGDRSEELRGGCGWSS